MAAKAQHQVLLNKLKRQVRVLQRKEEQTQRQLHAAIKRMQQLGHTYKLKFERKLRLLQGKMLSTQAHTYADIAKTVEKKLLQGIHAKKRAFFSAITQIETTKRKKPKNKKTTLKKKRR